MLVILAGILALSFNATSAEKDPEILFTVPKPQTLYEKIGYDFQKFMKEFSLQPPDTAPKRTWITPGTELKVVKVEDFEGQKFVLVEAKNNPNRRGWMRFDYLYYIDNGVAKQCPAELVAKLKDNAAGILGFLLGKKPDSKEYRSPPLTRDFSKRGADCTDYIKPDGTFGPKGQMALKEILGNGRSSDRWGYFKSNKIDGMNEVCPQFNNLSDTEKVNFWIWMLAALEWDEGTCRENVVRHDATNGIAAGALQVPENWTEGRSWRGPGCASTEPRVAGVNKLGQRMGRAYSMANSANYIPCAIEMLGGSLCGFYSYRRYPLRCDISTDFQSKPVNGEHLYWEKLRNPNSGRVMTLVKQFPLCTKGG